MFSHFSTKLYLFIIVVLISFSPLSAKTIKYDQILSEEDGYFYGYGKGASKEEANFIAKKNLIENALTITLKNINPAAKRVIISNQTVRIRLSKQKPYAVDKSGTYVVYRIKKEDWDKDEAEFQEYYVQEELIDSYSKLSEGSIGEQVNKIISILSKLIDYGEKDLFYMRGESTPLSINLEKKCKEIIQNLSIKPSISSGVVSSNTDFAVKVTDRNNDVVPNLKLKAVWDFPDLPDFIVTTETGSDGMTYIKYPGDSKYKSTCVLLSVFPQLPADSTSYQYLKKYESYSSVSIKYAIYSDDQLFFGVPVPGGQYSIGAVVNDKNASPKEIRKNVNIKPFEMGIYPVTNEQYKAYLFLTNNEETPEFFDNENYNGNKLPVVGISYIEAEKYAEWLSKQIGRKFRLPTSEEWEIAAKSGKETIYPWGDSSPAEEKIANYRGNGIYEYPSPVGIFDNSNSWGLYDMAGNVWEWTSTSLEIDKFEKERVVKGGSYMDGPNDLRSSNFKTANFDEKYADIGFRLVTSFPKNMR